MRIAITGATGFIGKHLIPELEGHEIVEISRRKGYDISNPTTLTSAFDDVDVVVHLAGINREIGKQTFENIHVWGTRNVVEAAKTAGVKRILHLSFLRARPHCGSPYHESKWDAEEIVRNSGISYVVLKPGMIYGKGDHMLDHLSHYLYTFPVIPTVGLNPKRIRPIAIDDMVKVLVAAVDGELDNQTVEIVGGEEIYLSDAIKRISQAINRKAVIFPLPIWVHKVAANLFEYTMKVPLVAKAQVRILSEGITESAPKAQELPEHLKPASLFNELTIVPGLPEPGRFTFKDDVIFGRKRKRYVSSQ